MFSVLIFAKGHLASRRRGKWLWSYRLWSQEARGGRQDSARTEGRGGGCWTSGSQLNLSNKLKRCKAVLKFSQVSSHTLHPFLLVPQPHFQERVNRQCQFLGSEEGALAGGALSPLHSASFMSDRHRERERGTENAQICGRAKLAPEQFSCLDENFGSVLFAGHSVDWPSWNHSYQPRQGKYY